MQEHKRREKGAFEATRRAFAQGASFDGSIGTAQTGMPGFLGNQHAESLCFTRASHAQPHSGKLDVATCGQNEEKLAAQMAHYEASLERQQQLVDRLSRDKAELIEKCELFLQELSDGELQFRQNIREEFAEQKRRAAEEIAEKCAAALAAQSLQMADERAAVAVKRLEGCLSDSVETAPVSSAGYEEAAVQSKDEVDSSASDWLVQPLLLKLVSQNWPKSADVQRSGNICVQSDNCTKCLHETEQLHKTFVANAIFASVCVLMCKATECVHRLVSHCLVAAVHAAHTKPGFDRVIMNLGECCASSDEAEPECEADSDTTETWPDLASKDSVDARPEVSAGVRASEAMSKDAQKSSVDSPADVNLCLGSAHCLLDRGWGLLFGKDGARTENPILGAEEFSLLSLMVVLSILGAGSVPSAGEEKFRELGNAYSVLSILGAGSAPSAAGKESREQGEAYSAIGRIRFMIWHFEWIQFCAQHKSTRFRAWGLDLCQMPAKSGASILGAGSVPSAR